MQKPTHISSIYLKILHRLIYDILKTLSEYPASQIAATYTCWLTKQKKQPHYELTQETAYLDFKVLAHENVPDTAFNTEFLTIAITHLHLGYEFLPLLNS